VGMTVGTTGLWLGSSVVGASVFFFFTGVIVGTSVGSGAIIGAIVPLRVPVPFRGMENSICLSSFFKNRSFSALLRTI